MKRTGIILTIALAVLLCGMYSNFKVIQSHQNSIDMLNDSVLKLSSIPFEKEVISQFYVNRTLRSCVVVLEENGYGSGAAVAHNIVLTAGHCIDSRSKLSVIDYNKKEYKVLDYWLSDKYDIGFLKIEGSLPFLSFGNVPNLLDNIYLVGSPLMSQHELNCINCITKGVVSNLNINWHVWTDGIIIDAAAYPGNSGGPLFNSNFEIIGIAVGCHNRFPNGGDNFWLCEPVTHIREALDEYLEAQ